MEEYLYDELDDQLNYHDDFDDDEELLSQQYALENLFEACIAPTVTQIFYYIGTFLIWNLVFRLTTQIVNVPLWMRHLSSILFGSIIIYSTIGYSGVYLIIYSGLVYAFLQILSFFKFRKFGYLLAGFSLAILVLCEMFETDKKLWHQIRGTQMVVAMKVISVGFDLDSGRAPQMPSFLTFFGYVLCPANSIVGPWVPLTEYLSIYESPRWNLQWVVRIVINGLLSMLFVVSSNCFVPSMISDSWKWSIAYRNALSFRMSHYFISFLSQTVMVTGGFNKESDSYLFGFQVTKPVLIELPRSIVQVVVAWNIPMHNWLKFYVFRNIKPYGIFKAIFVTYIVSALLHGMNVQLAVVLLSLGFYTYVEYQFRYKLGSIFGACILSNECRSNCSHGYKNDNIYVIVTNLIFGGLAVLHLTYLGVMFEVSTELNDEEFTFQTGLRQWSQLNYVSHWISLCCYIFYIFI